jgi:hypothetical protein
MKRPDASTDGPAFCVHGIWVHMAVCRLLAFNVGSSAASVGLPPRVLARNVSRKQRLFAGPSAAVCGPLQIPIGSLIIILIDE